MLAPTQRHHYLKYISLPLLVGIVLLVATKLIALQRADIIAELADRVAHRDSPEAAAAVRQLAAMPRAPVSILVSAATSADAEVSAEAKLCISRLLRRAQRQIEAGRRLGSVASQLAELAESLERQQGMFSKSDHPWLSSTTRKLLRLANRIPPGQTPLVAVHCDAILAGIASKEVARGSIADNEPEIEEPFLDEGASIDNGAEPRHARIQGEMPVALERRAKGGGAQKQRESADHIQSESERWVESRAERAEDSRPPMSPASRPRTAVASNRTESGEPMGDTAPVETSAKELMDSPWRASWTHPIFRMMPATPINAPATTEDAPASPPSLPLRESPPASEEVSDSPLAELEARELLQRWLNADGSEIFPLEEELTRRGFGRLSERFVEQLFSPKPEDRLAFVDAVLTEPGVDARPWLVLLSEDSEADVRLLAVTIMATSNDAALVEKAWQVSIRDRDPRIAGLARRLRERRESAQQR